MTQEILKMQNISKSFSGVPVLKNVGFSLFAGEIHALMGENGAGKSTLMKILTGIYQRDEGTVTFCGKETIFRSVRESGDAGIRMIHQELNNLDNLTVAQNVYIGREPMKSGILINDRQMECEAKELFQHIGIEIDPHETLGRLSVGRQQMVEIAKAVSQNAKLLILDEPTAALTSAETHDLFSIMRELREKGIGMIYISHRLEEIRQIADRVTVLRDGEEIGTCAVSEITDDEIVKKMVGRAIFSEDKKQSACPENAPVVLSVQNLSSGRAVKNVSFELHRGEILGLAGLMGAGRTETALAICGAAPKTGEIYLNGERVYIRSPREAVKHGICYLSEDRKRFGLLPGRSVAENTVLAALKNFVSFGRINDRAAEKAARETNDLLRTKTSSMKQAVRYLSGGNQQKVIIARWLLRDCDILIFDEPTCGIDVGAKSEIYSLIQKMAAGGKAILLISSDLSEIRRCSDRVIVLSEGYVTAELPIEEASQEAIMKAAMPQMKANA